ncbi:MAG TPA: DNA polymerase Y family protein [Phenylobacterium sp.]|nr:DNA polymerase Y family protein [Phenylobacterium sp.]
MGRILCAWSPSWAIANWRRRNPCASPAEARPFALIAAERGVRQLYAVDAQARQAGLFAGQKATDAAALCPGLVTAEAEPEADAQALTELADWCVRFSPAVALSPPDGLFLDIAGVSHLWGGEDDLAQDFRARLAANGLPVRVAVADTPGAAWALAHQGKDALTIVPPGQQAAMMARLRPSALRLEPQAAAQIERLGLKTLAQLLALPRAPLARRFGAATLTRIDEALGRSKEALVFRRPPSPWFARLAFAEPISALEDLQRVSHDVAARLCARLEQEGRGARRFEIAFHRVDGKAHALTIGLALAARDPVRIARLFAPKLETVDPGFGIEVVTIAATGVEPMAGRQVRLDALLDGGLEDGLAPLIDRLSNRLGEARVWKTVPVESHLPEQSAAPARPLAPAPEAAGWDLEVPRPLRLFRKPERLEGVISLVPDDPPRQFEWRRRLHRVRHAEGPERIGAEWWRREIEDVRIDQVRDYYRVEDQSGARFWVYREGLYSSGEPSRWFLHGLFG